MGTAGDDQRRQARGRCCSAVVSKIHGMAISTIAKTSTARQCRNAGRIAPARLGQHQQDRGGERSSTEHDTGGSSSFTATRMKKYGIPQMKAHRGEEHPAAFGHPLILRHARVRMQSQFFIESNIVGDPRHIVDYVHYFADTRP
jgi:hypothetical protein